MESLVWTHQTELTVEDKEDLSLDEIEKAEIKLWQASPRLWSAGLNGIIFEWDLVALQPKVKRTAKFLGGFLFYKEIKQVPSLPTSFLPLKFFLSFVLGLLYSCR